MNRYDRLRSAGRILVLWGKIVGFVGAGFDAVFGMNMIDQLPPMLDTNRAAMMILVMTAVTCVAAWICGLLISASGEACLAMADIAYNTASLVDLIEG